MSLLYRALKQAEEREKQRSSDDAPPRLLATAAAEKPRKTAPRWGLLAAALAVVAAGAGGTFFWPEIEDLVAPRGISIAPGVAPSQPAATPPPAGTPSQPVATAPSATGADMIVAEAPAPEAAQAETPAAEPVAVEDTVAETIGESAPAEPVAAEAEGPAPTGAADAGRTAEAAAPVEPAPSEPEQPAAPEDSRLSEIVVAEGVAEPAPKPAAAPELAEPGAQAEPGVSEELVGEAVAEAPAELPPAGPDEADEAADLSEAAEPTAPAPELPKESAAESPPTEGTDSAPPGEPEPAADNAVSEPVEIVVAGAEPAPGLSSAVLAAETAPDAAAEAGLDRVPVRTGDHPGFSRVVFDWPDLVGYQVTRSDGRVLVIFDRAAAIDLASLNAFPPKHVHAGQYEVGGDATRVTLFIAPTARLRHFRADTRVVLDVLSGPAETTADADSQPVEAPPAEAPAAETSTAEAPSPQPAPDEPDEAAASDEAVNVEALVTRQAGDGAPAAPGEPIHIERTTDAGESPVSGMITVINETDYFRDRYAAAQRALNAGQAQSALAIYDELLGRQPADRVALLGKATALHRLVRVGDAIRAYEAVLRHHPDELAALTNLLGLIGQQAPESALQQLQRIYSVNPSFGAVAAQMALIYAQLNDAANGLRFMREAVALEPRNPAYRINLAVMLDRAGEKLAAVRAYERALELAGDDAGTMPLSADAIRARLRYLRAN